MLARVGPVSAQQSIDFASVGGRVTDPSGAVVPGAQVSACHTHTDLTSSSVTDEDGRPLVNGAFIRRNAGDGSGFFSVSLRLRRGFRISRRLQVEGVVEAFNLTNTRNELTRNSNFGAGAYPTDPLPTFSQVTAVGEPRSVQLGVRVTF